jgi:hypothetical protein
MKKTSAVTEKEKTKDEATSIPASAAVFNAWGSAAVVGAELLAGLSLGKGPTLLAAPVAELTVTLAVVPEVESMVETSSPVRVADGSTSPDLVLVLTEVSEELPMIGGPSMVQLSVQVVVVVVTVDDTSLADMIVTISSLYHPTGGLDESK